MKFLVATNPHKGRLSAAQAAVATARALKRAYPGASCELMPLADGGPGTLNALHASLGGRLVTARVLGPLGSPVSARWLKKGRLAVIESAQAIGIELIKKEKLNPLRADSRGLGQLLLAAKKSGCKEIWVGLGGSCTTDAGLGMAMALGSPDALKEIRVRVLCDVDNPLYGRHGAAYVFAPQKGASKAQVKRLDARLRAAARLMPRHAAFLKGAGAAGGLGAGLVAFAGAKLVPGAASILKLCQFHVKMKRADWVVSGEGNFDSQSLRGKLPVAVAKAALKAGKKCMIVCGRAQKGLRLRGVKIIELKNLGSKN